MSPSRILSVTVIYGKTPTEWMRLKVTIDLPFNSGTSPCILYSKLSGLQILSSPGSEKWMECISYNDILYSPIVILSAFSFYKYSTSSSTMSRLLLTFK